MKLLLLPLLFLLAIATTATASHPETDNPIRLLKPDSIANGKLRLISDWCKAWRLAAEMNNNRDWDRVPDDCQYYIGVYVNNSVVLIEDLEWTSTFILHYAQSLLIKGDGKDIWVFSVDNVALSEFPYFYDNFTQGSAKPYDAAALEEWKLLGVAPGFDHIVDVYYRLKKLGFKIVFISGRSEEKLGTVTESNLKKVGYSNWDKLILRSNSEASLTNREFKTEKRAELVAQGYRIWGNVGAQWTDLEGDNAGKRVFKIVMPLYYLK